MIFTWSKKRHTKIEFWAGDGSIHNLDRYNPRWYWHKKVNGRVTDSGSYASRRSCRRALRRMFGEPD